MSQSQRQHPRERTQLKELPTYSDGMEVAAAEVPLPPVLRKKGTAWTEEEHILFLIGLRRYGKGDWKSIARYCVVSKTSSQVASHAQKYFIRQNASEKKRKRKSIHDITLGESNQGLVPHLSDHNWVPHPQNWELFQHDLVRPSNVATQQQLQEVYLAQEIFYSNPTNNLPQQMDVFGNSNNFLSSDLDSLQ